MRLTVESVAALKRTHGWFLAENERAMHEAAVEGAQKALATVESRPVFTPRTGHLQESTRTRVVRTKTGRLLNITNHAKYAKAIDQGSRAHEIAPRRKPYLTFKAKDGRWVRAKKVMHPGTKAYRFLENATQQGFLRIERALSPRMSRIASRF